MQCDEARRRLEELDLDTPQPPELAAHLKGCDDCRSYATALEELLQRATDLPDTAPSRELWPEISERLVRSGDVVQMHPQSVVASGSRRSARHLLPFAASLLVTVGLVFFVTREGDAPRLEPVAEERIQVAAWDDVIAASQVRAEQVLAALSEELPAESQIALAENIDTLDQAIREIQSAIDQNPGHTKLELLLASRVQQHARLIQRISHV